MDIATLLVSDGNAPAFDFSLDGPELAGDILKTAVIISLFTDRRALDSDALPETAEPRGWWADALGTRPMGSRLWLLGREKEQRNILLLARDYAQESLKWLVDDGIAASVSVEAEDIRPGVLALSVRIERSTLSAPEKHRFEFAWGTS